MRFQLRSREAGPVRESKSCEPQFFLNADIMNVNLECTLATMGLSSYGGGYMFSHQICTDLKNGPDEVKNH